MLNTNRKDIACIALESDEGQLAQAREQVTETARVLQNRLRFQARTWKVNTSPYAYLVDSLSDYGLYAGVNDLKRRIKDENPSNKHTYWHLFGVSASGAGGRAGVNDDIAVTTAPGDDRMAHHEEGHNLGLMHHVSGIIEKIANNYGGDCSMGTGNFYCPTCLDGLGQIADEHVGEGDGRYFLVRAETPDEAAKGCHKVVYFKRLGRWYSVHYHNGRVRIHTSRGLYPVDPPWRAVKQVRSLRLAPGDSKKGVTLVRGVEGVAEVTIGNAPARTLPDFEPRSQRITQGLWDSPKYEHQGFFVYVRDSQLVAYWFTHDEDGPIWLQINGPIDGPTPIYAPKKGDPGREQVKVGQAWLYAGGIYYWLDYSELLSGRGFIPLDQLAEPVDHPLTGIFSLGNSEGITAMRVKGDHTVGVEYGYVGRHRPTWWYLDGDRDMTVYKVRNGYPNIKADSWLEEVGQATLRRKSYQRGNRTKSLERLM